MGNCLVTKLKDVVNNEELLTMDEFYVNMDAGGQITVTSLDSTCKARVIGSTFSDGTKEKTLTANVDEPLIVASDRPCKIALSDKSGKKVFQNTGFVADTEQLKYTGVYRLYSSQLAGNVADIAYMVKNGYLDTINTTGTSKLSGDIASFNDAASIQNIKSFYMEGNSVYGDATFLLSNLSGLGIHLVSFSGENCSVYADLSQIGHDAILAYGNYYTRPGAVHEWKTTRDSSRKIIALFGTVNFGEDLDAMLINQAQCQMGYSGGDARYKTIQVLGTHTAPDADWQSAVTTLKSKGFTVIINDIVL